MIKAVFLDLDDTIFDFKACEKLALSSTLSHFSLSFTEQDLFEYSQINDKMWKLLERGEISRETLRIKRFEVFLERYHASSLDTVIFGDQYFKMLASTGVLIDGARDLLEHLSLHYDLYAVTNGYEFTQKGRIKCANIGKYFKDIFISQSIGAVKPNKEFFDRCIATIPDFSLNTSVLIGDSPTSDIKGGNTYGIYTIRYNPLGLPNPPDAIPRAEVFSLSEIPTLISSL